MDTLQRIECKIDKLDARQDRMEITQAKQHMSLEEHMRRTAANEEAIAAMQEELKPVKSHIAMFTAAAKLLAFVLVLAEIYRAIKGG